MSTDFCCTPLNRLNLFKKTEIRHCNEIMCPRKAIRGVESLNKKN